MQIAGGAWKYGDDVNTDVIFPGKYTYTLTERDEIASHALEDLDPDFAGQVQPGDIIVAGRNWGCGSSREQAATCLVYNGVGAVIAESFSRIFYRNALNNGLLAITCPEAVQAIYAGEQVAVVRLVAVGDIVVARSDVGGRDAEVHVGQALRHVAQAGEEHRER